MPTSQGVHDTLPSVPVYVPALQLRHDANPWCLWCEAFPATHARHVLSSAFPATAVDFPASQSSQVLAPAAPEYLPAMQSVHEPDPGWGRSQKGESVPMGTMLHGQSRSASS